MEMAASPLYWYEKQDGPSVITLLAMGKPSNSQFEKLECLFNVTIDICDVKKRKRYIYWNPDNEADFPFELPRDPTAARLMRRSFRAAIRATFLGQVFEATSDVALKDVASDDPRLYYYLLAAGHSEFGETPVWFTRSMMAKMYVNSETSKSILLNTDYYRQQHDAAVEAIKAEYEDIYKSESDFKLTSLFLKTRGQRDPTLRAIHKEVSQELEAQSSAQNITISRTGKFRAYYSLHTEPENVNLNALGLDRGIHYLFISSVAQGPTRLVAQIAPAIGVTVLVHILDCELAYCTYAPYIQRKVADFVNVALGRVQLVSVSKQRMVTEARSKIEAAREVVKQVAALATNEKQAAIKVAEEAVAARNAAQFEAAEAAEVAKQTKKFADLTRQQDKEAAAERSERHLTRARETATTIQEEANAIEHKANILVLSSDAAIDELIATNNVEEATDNATLITKKTKDFQKTLTALQEKSIIYHNKNVAQKKLDWVNGEGSNTEERIDFIVRFLKGEINESALFDDNNDDTSRRLVRNQKITEYKDQFEQIKGKVNGKLKEAIDYATTVSNADALDVTTKALEHLLQVTNSLDKLTVKANELSKEAHRFVYKPEEGRETPINQPIKAPEFSPSPVTPPPRYRDRSPPPIYQQYEGDQADNQT